MFKLFLAFSLLAEELTKATKDFLDSDAKINDKHEWLGINDAAMKGKGSSRRYYKFHTKKNIKIDGINTSIEHGIKIPVISNLDYYHDGDLFGKQQNKIESDSKLDKFRVLKKTKDGYTTNVNGVLSPVLSSNKNGKWVETVDVIPLEHSKYTRNESIAANNRMKNALSTSEFPNMSWEKIRSSLNSFNKLKHNNDHVLTDDQKNIVKNHPVGRVLADLLTHTNISVDDLSSENVGIWKHPITGKDHPVILDYGASKKLLSDYDDATDRYFNKEKPRVLNEVVLV